MSPACASPSSDRGRWRWNFSTYRRYAFTGGKRIAPKIVLNKDWHFDESHTSRLEPHSYTLIRWYVTSISLEQILIFGTEIKSENPIPIGSSCIDSMLDSCLEASKNKTPNISRFTNRIFNDTKLICIMQYAC